MLTFKNETPFHQSQDFHSVFVTWSSRCLSVFFTSFLARRDHLPLHPQGQIGHFLILGESWFAELFVGPIFQLDPHVCVIVGLNSVTLISIVTTDVTGMARKNHLCNCSHTSQSGNRSVLINYMPYVNNHLHTMK